MPPSIQEQPFKNEVAAIDDDRTGMGVETLKQAMLENLRYVVGKDTGSATGMDYFMAVAYTVRDRILARWLATKKSYSEHTSGSFATFPPSSFWVRTWQTTCLTSK
jgi:glycogen phosphorylase